MDLPFDVYAMVKPKTQADLTMLLEEALMEANNLLEAVTSLGVDPTDKDKK